MKIYFIGGGNMAVSILNGLKNKTCEIEVAKKKYKVNLEFQALHDPKNIMIKA